MTRSPRLFSPSLPAHRSTSSLVLLGVAISALALAGSGCKASGSVYVKSHPPGARVLIDGEDSGLRTPARLEVSSSRKKFVITVEKNGYNPVSQTVLYTTDIDPITPEEAVGAILCAPCCCGLPLLGLLEPVKVESSFVPSKIDVHLEPAGQGLRIHLTPHDAQVFIGGARANAFVSNLYSLAVGEHEVEIRSQGRRTFAQRVLVKEETYQDLRVELQLDGEGIIVLRPRRASTGDGEIKILVDGAVHDTRFGRPIRLDPGIHKVEIVIPGFEPWQSDVKVSKDGFLEIRPTLSRPTSKEGAPKPPKKVKKEKGRDL
jgi:hypothetical protein